MPVRKAEAVIVALALLVIGARVLVPAERGEAGGPPHIKASS